MTGSRFFRYFIRLWQDKDGRHARGGPMPVLIRKYKLPSGLRQEERIDDPDRIERYMKFFDKDAMKKLNAGQKVVLEKDEWELQP